MEVVNIAAYQFVEIANPFDWRPILLERCKELDLLGTIIIAHEGLNLFMAGLRPSTDAFLNFLRDDPTFESRFKNIDVKESISDHQPYGRMLVRVKKEIITMKHPTIVPIGNRAPAIDACTLKRWLDQGHDDDGKEVVLLDTRNKYEVDIGTFEGAVKFPIENFSDFPEAFLSTINDTDSDLKEKTIVSFCTGGIRCEKAALFMREAKVPNVMQLDGGILRYFEKVGGAHWQGECFVFDNRVAVDPDLQATKRDYRNTDAGIPNVIYRGNNTLETD